MNTPFKRLDYRDWFYGMFAVIGGGASSITAAVAANIIAPKDFSFAGVNSLKLVFTIFGFNALISLFLYLKQKPVPDVIQENIARIEAIEARNAKKDSADVIKDEVKTQIKDLKP